MKATETTQRGVSRRAHSKRARFAAKDKADGQRILNAITGEVPTLPGAFPTTAGWGSIGSTSWFYGMTFSVGSDRRFKKNINSMENSLAKILIVFCVPEFNLSNVSTL